jgi:DNA-binding transcriptional MerR regulator
MRVYTRDELDRLRLIKYLVDEAGVNLAGVQRLLSAVEIVERMRPLVGDDPGSRSDTRQRLARELDALSRVLGL